MDNNIILTTLTRQEIAEIVEDAIDRKLPGLADQNPKKHFTTEEVSAMFRVNRETVRNWVRKGMLTRVKVGNRNLYNIEEVKALFSQRKQQ